VRGVARNVQRFTIKTLLKTSQGKREGRLRGNTETPCFWAGWPVCPRGGRRCIVTVHACANGDDAGRLDPGRPVIRPSS
jgi:hypothetical protein